MSDAIHLSIGGYTYPLRCIEIDGKGVLVGGEKLRRAIRIYGACMGLVSHFVPDGMITKASDEALSQHIGGR